MKKTVTITILCFTILILITSCIGRTITPSGRIETRSYAFSNFSKFDISSAIEVELTQSDHESVVIDADDNLFPFLRVRQSGKEIEIDLDAINCLGEHHIKVQIFYVNFEELELSGASSGWFMNDVVVNNRIDIDLSGAADLEGNITASRIDLDLSGATQFNGILSADAIDLSLSGASNIKGSLFTSYSDFDLSGAASLRVDGKSTRIELECSGGSVTHCYDLLCEDLIANLSGSSECRHAVSKTIRADLSGGSRLYYDGEPAVLGLYVSGGSKLLRR